MQSREGLSGRPARWPAELAFLARHGFAPDILDRAAGLARRWGVTGDEALLAAGLARAPDVYRALADELGLPFLENPSVAVHALTRFPEAIRCGIAPLPEGAVAPFLYAPRGPAFVAMVQRPRGGRSIHLAIATPETLRLSVFAARGPAIASVAEGLARTHPEESFRAGATLGQVAASHVVAFGLGALALWGSGSVWNLAILTLSVPFFGLAAIKIAAAQEASPIRIPHGLGRVRDADLPVYTVLVPLYREGRVVERLLAALCALDYPAAKLDVKLLVETGDADTADALAGQDLPGFVDVVVVPPGAPRTKPRALNVGLAIARGRHLVVYDAEDVPDPGQLREAVATFEREAADVACLQARLVIDNTDDSFVTRFFTVEYAALFDVVNPALPLFDLPMPLGGTSNHFRTETLRELGGWDPWNVTEDADLAIRLATAGYRVADLPSATLEEAPATMRAWLAQRTRWMKGFLQVSVTHSRRPIRNLGRLGPVRLLGATALVFGAVVSALVYPLFTLLLIASLARGDLLEAGDDLGGGLAAGAAIALALAGLLAMTLPGLVALGRRGWPRLWPYALLMPVYYMAVSVAAWRGLYELLLDPDRWNKTEHGLARTSRAAGVERPLRAGGRAPRRRGPAAARR